MSGNIETYNRLVNLEMSEIMSYLDISEKKSRLDKIEEVENKIAGIDAQFSQAAPKIL